MIDLHTHTFTTEEAATLQAAIKGIRAAIHKAELSAKQSRSKPPVEKPRYEFESADLELLAAMSAIRAGDEIELDTTTWVWLQVQLETWMSDAPNTTWGEIWHLSGVIAALVDQAPQRSIPCREPEKEPETVPAKASQMSLFV